MLSHIQQRFASVFFLNFILEERYRTETEQATSARQEENNNQRFTPPPFLYLLSLSSYLPWAHLHSSPHLFFPFCCQATDRKSITWRRQNHRKSSQKDASRRCAMKHQGFSRIKPPRSVMGNATGSKKDVKEDVWAIANVNTMRRNSDLVIYSAQLILCMGANALLFISSTAVGWKSP